MNQNVTNKFLQMPNFPVQVSPFKLGEKRCFQFTSWFVYLFVFSLFACNPLPAQQPTVQQELFNQYENFKEPTIKDRRFKHHDIQLILEGLKNDAQFKIRHLGQSIEGRDIKMVSIGQGKTNVLLWSQMHGDEPTATMALVDIFKFFSTKNDFEKFKALLKKELTLHFIPMLNPDGRGTIPT